MNRKITLSGNAGSGKSTVGKLIAQKLGYEFVSVGDFSRKYAEKEFGLSINEFQGKCKQLPELDDLIDKKFKEHCNKHDSIVADYRLGFKFVENAFHVLLKVSDEMAFLRIRQSNRKQEDTDLENIKERNRTMRQRFIDKYGVDFTDESNYNLVIDTDSTNPNAILDLIISNT
jgi:predicted cytidylate kinase